MPPPPEVPSSRFPLLPWGVPCAHCPPSSKLYVANLPKRFGEAEVQAIFSRCAPPPPALGVPQAPTLRPWGVPSREGVKRTPGKRMDVWICPPHHMRLSCRFGPLQSIRMLRTQGVRGALGTALVTFENVEDAPRGGEGQRTPSVRTCVQKE